MKSLNRRSFLKNMGLIASSGMVQSTAVSLANINQAIAEAPNFRKLEDYKALVCVFLLGGNDHVNTLVPIDKKNFEIYKKYRGDIALTKVNVLPLHAKNTLEKHTRYGLHPQLTGLQKLFHQRKLAIVQNVGTLIQPTSKHQFKHNLVPLPPKLFSHNDQQAYWQTSNTESVVSQGWGAAMASASASAVGSDDNFFCCINLSKRSEFLSARDLNQYKISNQGAIAINRLAYGTQLENSNTITDIVRKMMTAPRNHVFEKQISDTFAQSLFAEGRIRKAFNESPSVKTPFANDELSKQLQTVIKLISVHKKLGMKRQVFLVGLGGFDTHDDLMDRHYKLMNKLDTALSSFYQATEDLNLSDKVTTFTMSEFGRTFGNNGDGTDHGWGSHHFIMGGAVKGQRIYGKTPSYGVKTPDAIGKNGRMLPTTSVDQYAATLAYWFGVPKNKISLVAPNIHNFKDWNIGFI